MVDGLNFKDFVAFLSAFSAKASLKQKVKRKYCRQFPQNRFRSTCSLFPEFYVKIIRVLVSVIFQVYDSDCNGKVSFNDIMQVLRDLSGSFMSDEQREVYIYIYVQNVGNHFQSSFLQDCWYTTLSCWASIFQLSFLIMLSSNICFSLYGQDHEQCINSANKCFLTMYFCILHWCYSKYQARL